VSEQPCHLHAASGQQCLKYALSYELAAHGLASDFASDLFVLLSGWRVLQRVEVRLINYKKDGTPFLNRLRVTPLTTSLGQYTHMLGILEEVPVQSRNTAGQAQRGLARGANAAEQAQREQQQELAAQA
jgi:hypothetical protein